VCLLLKENSSSLTRGAEQQSAEVISHPSANLVSHAGANDAHRPDPDQQESAHPFPTPKRVYATSAPLAGRLDPSHRAI